MKLVNSGRLNLFYTSTGKEFLTPKQLEREIQDELLQNRGLKDPLFLGRVSLLDLQNVIDVDLSHIENCVSSLVKKNPTLQLIHGDLVAGT